eukprot:4735811-Lingulodinium_polyedra.AAC.1
MGRSCPCTAAGFVHARAARAIGVCFGLLLWSGDWSCAMGPCHARGSSATGEGWNGALWTRACLPGVFTGHPWAPAATQRCYRAGHP